MSSYLFAVGALSAGAAALLTLQTAADRKRDGALLPAAYGAVCGLALFLLLRALYRLALG